MARNYVAKSNTGQYLGIDEDSDNVLVNSISEALIFVGGTLVDVEEIIQEAENQFNIKIQFKPIIIMEEENFNELMKVRGT